MSIDQIQHFFLHQVNLNILTETMAVLGAAARSPSAPVRCSWTAVASGDTYMLAGIGAGFQWGSLCLRHA
ncbi:hypothetical protein AB0L47_24595 [Streptomyces bobili]|uniref:hypothetical protein n=1 Tax=Streptomyces bobili TaxID=67280 RepID=UPI003445457E